MSSNRNYNYKASLEDTKQPSFLIFKCLWMESLESLIVRTLMMVERYAQIIRRCSSNYTIIGSVYQYDTVRMPVHRQR